MSDKSPVDLQEITRRTLETQAYAVDSRRLIRQLQARVAACCRPGGAVQNMRARRPAGPAGPAVYDDGLVDDSVNTYMRELGLTRAAVKKKSRKHASKKSRKRSKKRNSKKSKKRTKKRNSKKSKRRR